MALTHHVRYETREQARQDIFEFGVRSVSASENRWIDSTSPLPLLETARKRGNAGKPAATALSIKGHALCGNGISFQ